MKAKSYAAMSPDQPLEYYEFDRREPTEYDVEVKIKYSGVCHSDIHRARGEWGETEYPCVVGHEIIGEVSRVGVGVSNHKVGDIVGVGVLVNSCGSCESCEAGTEQYCDKGPVKTYASVDPLDGITTKGGYSDVIVTTEKFVIPIPDGLDISKAAPLLCAGVTMYSPLKHWDVKPGKKVAILGLGGLGHMGVKYAKAMGAEVWVITSSPEKAEDAKNYGADGVIVSSSDQEMGVSARTFDLILDTVPVEHDLKPYIDLLNVGGVICLIGPLNPMPGYHGADLIGSRKSIAGSMIGGIAETVEMLQFSVDHGILPDVKGITMEEINDAWDDMVKKGMSQRYVIDIEKSFKA